MASIGLRTAKYNKIDYTTKKYAALKKESIVPVLGRLIDAKINEERNSTELRADDIIAEKDTSFKGGTLNLTVDDVMDETYADVKGCTISEKEVTDNSDDVAPEIGYGHIVTKIYKGVKNYKVEFLPRIQITKITADRKTKGESIEYSTVSIEADIMELEEAINGMKAGDWKKVETFATLAEAQTYLDGLLTPSE